MGNLKKYLPTMTEAADNRQTQEINYWLEHF